MYYTYNSYDHWMCLHQGQNIGRSGIRTRYIRALSPGIMLVYVPFVDLRYFNNKLETVARKRTRKQPSVIASRPYQI